LKGKKARRRDIDELSNNSEWLDRPAREESPQNAATGIEQMNMEFQELDTSLNGQIKPDLSQE